jgi:hypothetical protein
MLPTILRSPPANEHQPSVNDFECCNMYKQIAMQWCYSTINVLAVLEGKHATNDIATAFPK